MTPLWWWRAGLLMLAVLLAAGAALMYVSDGRQVKVLVLARDVPAGKRLVEADLGYKQVARSALPPGTFSDPAPALGMYSRGPLPEGQYLVARQLDPDAGRAMAESSFSLPPEWSLLALPMEFEHALGGALSPGQVVDLYAVPKRSAGSGEILVPGARLVDLRSPDGQSLALARPPGLDADEPIGSVLLAVPRALLAGIIARIENSLFVLASAAGGGP
jgi:Flp pilus assembly protein CpaB